MSFLGRIFGSADKKPTPKEEPVIVVSGLPRSGTSMMMKMLEAGGLQVFVDNLRTPDDDNPEGYYEYERVKQLDKGDAAWVKGARGQVVKVISALLEYLPPENSYQVIFMHRHLHEVLASQQKMLTRREETAGALSDEEMAELFRKHLDKVAGWLQAQPNFKVLDVDYNQLLADPAPQVHAANAFLGNSLDEKAMAAVINPGLYRNRS
jgi:hypothetical protein